MERQKYGLFNTEMTKAILGGTKTATRRVVKPKYTNTEIILKNGKAFETAGTLATTVEIRLPYQVGDILYVRETWAELETVNGHLYYAYKADDDTLHHSIGGNFTHWCPSIHMPKEAARIFLKVTDVWIEKLQDIGGYGVLAEGVDNGKSNPTMGVRWENMQRLAYSEIWNSTIKKSDLDKYGWDANPWVTVNEFERISKEEAVKK